MVGFFFHDDYKITSKLTFNLGVRWEPFFPFTDENGKITVWNPGAQSTRYPNAPKGVLYVGDPGVPKGTIKPVYHNFAPRLGFADNDLIIPFDHTAITLEDVREPGEHLADGFADRV